MADDLVAELTLRLRNEMTAGIDEVRSQFTTVEGAVEGLKESLSSVDRLMAEMHGPVGLESAVGGMTAELDGTAAAMRDMGATLDAEAAKARALLAETTALPEALGAATPGAGSAAIAAETKAIDELRDAYQGIATEAGAAASATKGIGADLEGASHGANDLLAATNRLHDATFPSALTQGFHEGAQAAADMASSVDAIGRAIDTDATKLQQMLVQMHEDQAEMQRPQTLPGPLPVRGGGEGFPPGGAPPPEEEPQPGPRQPGQPQPSSSKGGGFDIFSTLLGAVTGITGFDAWSEYDTAAKQIAVTEGLGPEAAQHEVSRLKDMMNGIADRYYASSKDLLSTYQFLITDSLSKQTVETMLPSLAEASTAYNVPTSDIAQAAFTLTKNLGIPPEKMGDALAVLHHATMQGHFTMEDFSQFLPELGGQESLIGMTGMPADVTTASALETIRKNTGTGGEAATELKEFLMYLHSMMALRMFDRTKRMEDMLGPSGKAIFDKYHIEPLDLPQYLDHERAVGMDPVNALTNYFAKLLEPVKSPIERADLVGAYFHNQAAQDAILALVQYRDDFYKYQSGLSHVSDKTLATDFDTATSGPSADARSFQENLAQGMRMTGRLFDYPIEAGNWIWNPNVQHGPPAAADHGTGTSSGITLSPHIPITVNVHVDKDGNATVEGGLAGAPDVAPGTNVRVNQGNVLTGVH